MDSTEYLKQKLSVEERLLVNSEVEKNAKNSTTAYLLWFFTGFIGGHRYYFGKTGSAVAMTLITCLTLGAGVIVTAIWALVDVFMISTWLKDDKQELEGNEVHKMLAHHGATARQQQHEEPVTPETREPEHRAEQ